jgi:hypothetical protein
MSGPRKWRKKRSFDLELNSKLFYFPSSESLVKVRGDDRDYEFSSSYEIHFGSAGAALGRVEK